MKEALRQLIDTPAPQPVSREAVERIETECPAFVYPLILALRHPHPDMSDGECAAIIQRIALSIPDRSRLRRLLDPDGTGAFDTFYPAVDRQEAPSTFDAIGTFLDNYGSHDPAEEEMLNRMIFNPVPADYALTLDAPADATTDAPQPPASDADALIDSFIRSHPEPSAPVAKPAPEPEPQAPQRPAPGSLLSESLARIFIKQGHYDRAYEIIRSLSLNYPEKSIYFADQLRFLRKLIINNNAIERNKSKNKK